ncbi:MAG: YigZ family protein [Nonlabens sp.]
MIEPNQIDRFLTIVDQTPPVLTKAKGSKFYSQAIPFTTPAQLSEIIETTRSSYPKAGHHCYAYRTQSSYRVNDDGEPLHSAGDPILGQIDSYQLVDVLVVVSRIFGGIKLGMSGLIKAYREGAQTALQAATIAEKHRTHIITAICEYEHLNTLNQFIRSNQYDITARKMLQNVELKIAIPLSHLGSIDERSKQLHHIHWNYDMAD